MISDPTMTITPASVRETAGGGNDMGVWVTGMSLVSVELEFISLPVVMLVVTGPEVASLNSGVEEVSEVVLEQDAAVVETVLKIVHV